MVSVYLDTCIISGRAEGDMSEKEASALQRILEARKRQAIALATSEEAGKEIDAVPEPYRRKHEVIYSLLEDVPAAPTHHTDSGLTLVRAGGGRREDGLFRNLKSLLPDEMDARHVFQAARNQVALFLTTDHRTILHFTREIEELCGVRAVSPIECDELISALPDA